jgi:hypothetical protein
MPVKTIAKLPDSAAWMLTGRRGDALYRGATPGGGVAGDGAGHGGA